MHALRAAMRAPEARQALVNIDDSVTWDDFNGNGRKQCHRNGALMVEGMLEVAQRITIEERVNRVQ